MRLLLGIPTFRRPAALTELLASIARQRLPTDVELSVFVADNDPRDRDGLRLVAEMPDYRWPLAVALVDTPGIDANRNRILAEAHRRGMDLVAMIDDDETASPDWLAALVAAAVKHRGEVVGGPVLYRPDVTPPAGFAASGAYRVKDHADGPIAMFTSTANVLFDCAMLDRLDWPVFDPSFGLTGGGDKEFFTRLAKAGARFAWSRDAVVHERVPASRLTVKALMRRAFGIGGSDYRIDRLHGGAGAARSHLVRSVVLLAAAPMLAPALLMPATRLWLLRRFARAAGRLAAARGHRLRYYGG